MGHAPQAASRRGAIVVKFDQLKQRRDVRHSRGVSDKVTMGKRTGDFHSPLVNHLMERTCFIA